jgi:hypothetical protein
MTCGTVIARSRHADACIHTKRPWQSIFFHLNAAKDGLLDRCASRNDEVGRSKPMTIVLKLTHLEHYPLP